EPTNSTKRPVAKGSRVPVCPIFGFLIPLPFRMPRTLATTSNDVQPDGFMISNMPSTKAIFYMFWLSLLGITGGIIGGGTGGGANGSAPFAGGADESSDGGVSFSC